MNTPITHMFTGTKTSAIAIAIAMTIGMQVILPANAQSVSSGEIIDSLKPKKQKMSKTRSFGKAAEEEDTISAKERSFIQNLDATRAIKVEERDKLIEIVDKGDLPSINVQIRFAYDSDRIEGSSFSTLNEIAEALEDDALSDAKIMLNGHTDASGSRAYNQDLSERRALSVKRYLTDKLHISAKRIVATGFGEDRLKDKSDPQGGQNRRVEIVNLGS